MPSAFEKYAAEVESGLTEWEPPIPFDDLKLPPFPTQHLPGVLSDFVECLAESTQTDEAMSGLLSLGVLATAFQARYIVEVNSDWSEPLCLFVVAIAAPGERKSAVISALTRPIYEFEAEQRTLDAPDIARNESERKMLEGLKAAAETAAVKAKREDREAKRQEAMDYAAQLAEFTPMYEKRLLADDATPEKLISLMQEQHGAITVCSSEGGVFDSMAGRYERQLNINVFLQGHAGDPIVVDRIGRKSCFVENPRMSMILTVQPEILAGMMNNTAFRGRGLTARFLYAVCPSRVGRRKINPDPVPEKVKQDYRAFIRRILSDQGTGVIHLSPEAAQQLDSYAAHIEKQLGDKWENMRDWGNKATGAMLRLAALFHCAEVIGDPTETPISVETLTGAISVTEFLGAHAAVAYQCMGADAAAEDGKYLLRRINSAGADQISRRDLFRLCHGKFRRVDDMQAGINELIERGYLREIEQSTGGRPTKILMVNPFCKSGGA